MPAPSWPRHTGRTVLHITWNDGQTYTGEWRYNLKDGDGVMTKPDGSSIKGYWENDKLLKEIKK
jgi:hypothetical protein